MNQAGELHRQVSNRIGDIMVYQKIMVLAIFNQSDIHVMVFRTKVAGINYIEVGEAHTTNLFDLMT